AALNSEALPLTSAPASVHNGPIAVPLAACMPGRWHRTAIDPNCLGEAGATEAVAVLVVVVDFQRAVIAALVVAPAIVCVLTAGLETAIVSAVDITAILAIQIAPDTGAYGASGNRSEDGPCATRGASCDGIAQKPAGYSPDNQAARLVAGVFLLTIAVIGILICAVGMIVIFMPLLLGSLVPVVLL